MENFFYLWVNLFNYWVDLLEILNNKMIYYKLIILKIFCDEIIIIINYFIKILLQSIHYIFLINFIINVISMIMIIIIIAIIIIFAILVKIINFIVIREIS